YGLVRSIFTSLLAVLDHPYGRTLARAASREARRPYAPPSGCFPPFTERAQLRSCARAPRGRASRFRDGPQCRCGLAVRPLGRGRLSTLRVDAGARPGRASSLLCGRVRAGPRPLPHSALHPPPSVRCEAMESMIVRDTMGRTVRSSLPHSVPHNPPCSYAEGVGDLAVGACPLFMDTLIPASAGEARS